MKFLTDEQLRELQPAETSSLPSPVPTQIVSSDEYMPVPQTAKQREVEARLKELSDRLARRQGLSRRRFFQTASGMAASFLVMNQVFGRLFEVSEAEAATPDMAADAHRVIRQQIRSAFGADASNAVRILYGGSVKPDNTRTLMAQPEIDGVLVGGARLDAASFASIVNF